MAAENRGRQVEITSLQPGTTKGKIRGAFTPLGEVEFVDITHKRHGAMVAATVTFITDRPVKELQEQGIRVMFVGNVSGRITRLRNEGIVFHKDLDRASRNPTYSDRSGIQHDVEAGQHPKNKGNTDKPEVEGTLTEREGCSTETQSGPSRGS